MVSLITQRDLDVKYSAPWKDMMAQRLARRAEDQEVLSSSPARDLFLNHDQVTS